jgi:putative addiction module killer protein
VIEVRRYTTPSGRDVFDDWLERLRDRQAQARILARIARLAAENFGDSKYLRDGVSELRVPWGPDIAFTTQ